MRKVAVIGHFGFGREYLDGQTVKTKIVAQELERRFGETQVLKSDTHGGAKTLLKAPFHVFRALRKCENVVILPAHNGLRVIAPLLAFERRFFKNRKIHYAVIGGWLPEFLTKRPRLAKALKTFDGIYVETNVMKRALEAQGFANVWVMPNCKYLDALDESELVYPTSEPYKLCTFSRVMREKGIEDAVDAVKKVNERFGRTVYTLDIYGPVDAAQTEWFDALQKTFPDFVAYRGSVPFDKSVETLKDAFALLFPTRFFTEGVPGTIVDAYAAGVPVVSARWESFADVVDDEATGYGYPFDDEAALTALLTRLVEEPELATRLKIACLAKAKAFRPEVALETLAANLR